MFVPIVRRTVTVTARDVFHFQFQCDNCYLQTWAHAFGEGVGSASMAYLAPDAEAARQRAWHSAQQNAWATFSKSPCPRCGAHSASERRALQAWEEKAESRKKWRNVVLLAGLAGSFLWSASCATIVAIDEKDGGVGLGVFFAIVWMFLGVVGTVITWALLGPGKRPELYPGIPPNVTFDPPPAGS